MLPGVQMLFDDERKATAIEWNYERSIPFAYGTAPYSARGLSSLSYAAWAWVDKCYTVSDGGERYGVLFGWGSTGSWGGMNIGINPTTVTFRGGTYDRVSYCVTQTSPQRRWIHLAAVQTEKFFKCYINGDTVAFSESPVQFGSQVATRFKCIRGDYADSDGLNEVYTNAALANIVAYDRALTDGEVRGLASSMRPLTPSTMPSGAMFCYTMLDGNGVSSVPNVVAGDDLTIVDGSDGNIRRGIPFVEDYV